MTASWRHLETGTPVTAGRIEKMSKSKRNVIDPELIISTWRRRYRAAVHAVGPLPERDMEWTESGVEGASRFLKRLYRMQATSRLPPLPVRCRPRVPAPNRARRASRHHGDVGGHRGVPLNKAAQLYTLANAVGDLREESPEAASARRFAVETLTRFADGTAYRRGNVGGARHDTMLDDSAWPKPTSLVADKRRNRCPVNGKLGYGLAAARRRRGSGACRRAGLCRRYPIS